MAKGLAEATDMVGGALFDQCKSDVGTASVGPQNRFTASISRTPFSHRCTVLSHTSAFSLHKGGVPAPVFLSTLNVQVCALADTGGYN